MNDAKSRIVRDAVADYLSRVNPQFDFWDTVEFDQLVRHAGRAAGAAEEDQLRLVTATCYLSPQTDAPPPVDLRNKLLDTFRASVDALKERNEQARHFAVAFGCGWRRETVADGGWHAIWPNAVAELAHLMEGDVWSAHDDLKDRVRVVGFPTPGAGSVRLDASLLATRLVHPLRTLHNMRAGEDLDVRCTDYGTWIEPIWSECGVPPGAKAVLTVYGNSLLTPADGKPVDLQSEGQLTISAQDCGARLDARNSDRVRRVRQRSGELTQVRALDDVRIAVWACTCGTGRCEHRHRLRSWDPSVWPLDRFIGSAVKGPRIPVRTRSFTQGLYYALLSKEGLPE